MDGEAVIIDNIKSRRSIRSFENRPVPRQLIEKILEAGRFAPSSLNRQPWKFIVISDPKLIEELSRIATGRIKKLYRLLPLLKLFSRDLRDPRVVKALKKTIAGAGDTVFYNAPLLIFIANDKRTSDSQRECYLAAQNMLLAAHSLGIGSCFIGRGRAIPEEMLLKRFDLPGYYDINIHLAFGYPKEFPKTPPVRREDTVKWV